MESFRLEHSTGQLYDMFERCMCLTLQLWMPTPTNFGFGDLRDSLELKVQHRKTTMTIVLDIFTNSMKIFQDDVGKMEKSVELQIMKRQEKGIGRIRNTFFPKEPVSAPSSASPVAFSETSADRAARSAAKHPSNQSKRDMRTNPRQPRG